MSIELRYYQQEAIEAALDEFRQGRDALVEAATGAGKSIVMASIAKQCEDRYGVSVLCLVHRKTLVEQNKRAFEMMGSKAVVETIQKVGRYEAEHYNLVIVDECHRLPDTDTDTQYANLLNGMRELNPKLRLLGVTATPYRLDVGHIYGRANTWFGGVCYKIGTRQLQKEGYLAPLKYKVCSTIDTSNIRTSGDYNEGQLTNELVKERHLDSIKHAIPTDRKAVAVFCVTIAHAEAVAARIGGMCLTSANNKTDRKAMMRRFSEYGGILVSVMALTEGWDATNCDCVVIARPTLSTALFVQMVGRGLRIHPDKTDCLVLDLVGCYNRHGSPYNPTIKVKAKDGPEREDLRREEVCPECGFVTEEEICPECGCNIKELNAEDGVQYLNKPVPLEVVELEQHDMVHYVESERYTSKSGGLCIRMSYFNGNGLQLATDYFSMSSTKVTPKRKLRKAVKALYGIDLGTDFTTSEALEATRNPVKPTALEIEINGRYKNAIW